MLSSIIFLYYTIKRAAKRQQLHTANEAEQEGNLLLLLLLSQRTVVREDALYAQFTWQTRRTYTMTILQIKIRKKNKYFTF